MINTCKQYYGFVSEAYILQGRILRIRLFCLRVFDLSFTTQITTSYLISYIDSYARLLAMTSTYAANATNCHVFKDESTPLRHYVLVLNSGKTMKAHFQF